MALHNYSDLSPMHLDVLREIGSIGTGNAATSLATMLQRSVSINVPAINVLDYERVAEELGGLETMIVGIMLTISGEVNGMMMFLLQKDFAHTIVNDLLGGCFNGFHELDDLSVSAIQEIGNIMTASYVNAIAQLTGLTIEISVPSMAVDMAGAILSVPAIYFADISDKVIFIQDELKGDSGNMISHILLIPTTDSLQRIMLKLGVE